MSSLGITEIFDHESQKEKEARNRNVIITVDGRKNHPRLNSTAEDDEKSSLADQVGALQMTPNLISYLKFGHHQKANSVVTNGFLMLSAKLGLAR